MSHRCDGIVVRRTVVAELEVGDADVAHRVGGAALENDHVGKRRHDHGGGRQRVGAVVPEVERLVERVVKVPWNATVKPSILSARQYIKRW